MIASMEDFYVLFLDGSVTVMLRKGWLGQFRKKSIVSQKMEQFTMKTLLYILSLIFIAIGVLVTNKCFGESHSLASIFGKECGTAVLVLNLSYPLWRLITSRALLFLKMAEIFCIFSFIYMLCAELEVVRWGESVQRSQKMQVAFANLVCGLQGAGEEPETYTQKEYGEFAYAFNTLKKARDESFKEIERLDKIIEEGRLPEKFLVKNLCSLDEIKKGLDTLKIMDQKLNIRLNSTKRLNSYADFFISSPTWTRQPDGRDFSDGYIEGRKRAEPILEELVRTERDWMREMRDLFIFLEAIQGSYSYENEQIVFENMDHLDRFRAFMTDIQKFAEQEEALVTKIQDEATQSITAMQKILKENYSPSL